jgi:hypothetical protein
VREIEPQRGSTLKTDFIGIESIQEMAVLRLCNMALYPTPWKTIFLEGYYRKKQQKSLFNVETEKCNRIFVTLTKT